MQMSKFKDVQNLILCEDSFFYIDMVFIYLHRATAGSSSIFNWNPGFLIGWIGHVHVVVEHSTK